jgi:Acetyltransferase (GNAT) domain
MTASPEPETKDAPAPRWQVREAVPADYDQICAINWDILRETEGQKTAGFSRRLWEWQYLGPEEKSLITVADDHGTIAGYIHGLRFPYRWRGTRIVSSMTQDAATVPAYRRQGLLRAVHAFAREEFARTGAPFSVGFPNHRSFPDYVRTKYTVVAKVPVYVCPLDFGRLLAPRLRAAGRLLGAAANPLYRALFARRPALLAGEEVTRVERFGPEIEPISRDFADMVTVAIDRTSRYLNWRFIEKPTHDYAAWVLRRGGQPVAYVVTKDGNLYGNPGLILMDFGCRAGEEDALLRLIAVRLPAAQQAGAAGAVSMGLHPFFARLGRLGFRRVPERVNPRPFHFVAKALREECDPAIFDPRSWFVTLADWDVL